MSKGSKRRPEAESGGFDRGYTALDWENGVNDSRFFHEKLPDTGEVEPDRTAPQCGECGYDLEGLYDHQGACPGCGRHFPMEGRG